MVDADLCDDKRWVTITDFPVSDHDFTGHNHLPFLSQFTSLQDLGQKLRVVILFQVLDDAVAQLSHCAIPAKPG
jgi:hypothetical protein